MTKINMENEIRKIENEVKAVGGSLNEKEKKNCKVLIEYVHGNTFNLLTYIRIIKKKGGEIPVEYKKLRKYAECPITCYDPYTLTVLKEKRRLARLIF